MGYLDSWEKSVMERSDRDYSQVERKNMLLSQETLLGLRMTGK